MGIKIKDETITARCGNQVKKILYLISHQEKLSMSEVLAKSILEYYKRHFPDGNFYKHEVELFGRYGSGKSDLSADRKKYLKERLNAKHSRS
ncbi:MAG: hypothetical protein ABH883_09920 [Candidatus Omnitrophota bacterium]